jgi:Tfp pilus assembly protein PilN
MNEPDQISFLPEDYLDRKAQRRTNVICAVLAGIVMAAIGSAFSLTEKVNRQAESQHAQVEQKYTEAAKQIQQFQELGKEESKMAKQAELAASLLEKIPRSIVLAEVSNSVPTGVSLMEFTMDSRRKTSSTANTPPPAPNKAPAQNAAPDPIAYDVTLTVTGIAGNDVQVAEFIHRLGLVPMFQDVNLVISDEFTPDDKKVTLRRFQVLMTLNSDADLTALDTSSSGRNTTVQLPSN